MVKHFKHVYKTFKNLNRKPKFNLAIFTHDCILQELFEVYQSFQINFNKLNVII